MAAVPDHGTRAVGARSASAVCLRAVDAWAQQRRGAGQVARAPSSVFPLWDDFRSVERTKPRLSSNSMVVRAFGATFSRRVRLIGLSRAYDWRINITTSLGAVERSGNVIA